MMTNRTELITSSLSWTPCIHPSIHVPSRGPELWPGSKTGGDGAGLRMTNRNNDWLIEYIKSVINTKYSSLHPSEVMDPRTVMEQGLMMINRTDFITSSRFWTPSIHPASKPFYYPRMRAMTRIVNTKPWHPSDWYWWTISKIWLNLQISTIPPPKKKKKICNFLSESFFGHLYLH